MNLVRLISTMAESLSDHYEREEAKSIVNILVEHVTGKQRLEWMLNPVMEIGAVELRKMNRLFRRLMKHEPIQYVTGKAYFHGLQFAVNRSVLIPRPETEELVSLAADIIKDHNKDGITQVLDIGTGSGCIAIALKVKCPAVVVTAVDKSVEALNVARRNASHHHAEITFLKADILKPPRTLKEKQYDLIISNPPYVRESEKRWMHVNVLDYEPHEALFVSDDDPLIFYRAIADFSLHHLKAKGILLFEINEAMGEIMHELLKVSGFENIRILKDMRGKDRFAYASKPGK